MDDDDSYLYYYDNDHLIHHETTRPTIVPDIADLYSLSEQQQKQQYRHPSPS
jgi:hypothetical protein